MRPITPPGDAAQLDLDAADLRISRGSVPASAQLAEALKAEIIQQRLPRGGRLAGVQDGEILVERDGQVDHVRLTPARPGG